MKPKLTRLDDPALNAEAAPHLLDDPITPEDLFFVRNNGALPQEQDPGAWRLAIDGCVTTPLTLSIDDMKTAFDVVEVTAVLECAGNGRSLFKPPAEGLQWGLGAVGCAVWTGVRLGDVLRKAGIEANAVYVAHQSPDVMLDGSGRPALSRGLPLAKALAPETLIAFAMNGRPLPHMHGGPIRIVAPGFPGSAWQKWLNRIWVRDTEHDGEKMTGANYRLPTAPVAPGDDLSRVRFDVIVDMPPRAMVTWPAPGFAAPADEALQVRGFAWSGHVALDHVDVSADGGSTWRRAELEPERHRFAWRRFRCAVGIAAGQVAVMARAADVSGRSQPLDQAPWNPRGYCNNAVHRVPGAGHRAARS